jgi:prepilin-type N-terminal cleavage/methylation domain-containing protein
MSAHAWTTPARRGFTLIEATLTIIIIGIVAAVAMPVIVGAGDAYAYSAATRRTAEKGAYAIERVVRLLRDAPAGVLRGTVDLAQATPTLVRFGDGRGVELSGTTLSLRAADGTLSTLCDGVQAFTLEYLGADGVTDTSATPEDTQRFNITVRVGSFELRSAALARVRVKDR